MVRALVITMKLLFGLVGVSVLFVSGSAFAQQTTVVEARGDEGSVLYLSPHAGDPPTRVCVVPCEAEIAPGRYLASVAFDVSSTPRPAGEIFLPHSRKLDVRYVDRNGLRLAGWITMGASLLVGTAIVATAVGIANIDNRPPCPPMCTGGAGFNVPMLIMALGGMALGLAGGVTGLILATRRDYATVEAL